MEGMRLQLEKNGDDCLSRVWYMDTAGQPFYRCDRGGYAPYSMRPSDLLRRTVPIQR